MEKQQSSADTAQSKGLWLRFCSVVQFKLKLRMVTSVQDPNPMSCTVLIKTMPVDIELITRTMKPRRLFRVKLDLKSQSCVSPTEAQTERKKPLKEEVKLAAVQV